MNQLKIQTLRQLVDSLAPEFLDVPLQMFVTDGHKNAEVCDAPADLWAMPRSAPNATTGETGHLYLQVKLHRNRLVKERTP